MVPQHQLQMQSAETPRHWAAQLPYRTIVYIRSNRTTPLFAVAGVEGGPWKAIKALKLASRKYKSSCFYCGNDSKLGALTIDHIDPRTRDGKDDLSNLVLACRPCNLLKADKPIETFRPELGREWLSTLLRQVQERLNRLA